jgi:transposase
MPRKPKYDWKTIEDEFIHGMDSVAEIARRHGCTDSAVHKHMSRRNIVRVRTNGLDPVDAQLAHKLLVEKKTKSEAAKELGLAKSTVTERTQRTEVKATMNAYNAEVARNCGLDSEKVIREEMRLAFSDLGDLYDEDGKLRPVKDIPKDARRALKEVRSTPAGTEYKLHDKKAALGNLHKFLGHFANDNASETGQQVTQHIYQAIIMLKNEDRGGV